jgi:hypothetical protein
MDQVYHWQHCPCAHQVQRPPCLAFATTGLGRPQCGGFSWFSDRGNLLSASRILFSQYDLLLSIKYCLEHIIHNVTVKFGLKKSGQTQLRTLIQECQTSQTIAHFHFAIEKVFEYPQSTTKPLCGYKMALYLLLIHPIHWTVFGNHVSLPKSTWSVAYKQLILRCLLQLGMVSEDDDEELVHLIVESQINCTVPRGQSFPLYFTCRNNNAEGMASAFRMLGIHHHPPPTAAHQFLKFAVENLKEYQNECERVDPLVHQLTPLGMKWYNDYFENIGMDSCQLHISAVRRGHGPNTHVIVITKDEASCDCCHHDMTDSLCQHIRYALLSLESARSCRLTEEQKQLWLINVFPPCLLVYEKVNSFFQHMTLITIPSFGGISHVLVADIVFSHPTIAI